LSEAYNFLRCLEHRLQMEHGLQTHTVPESEDTQALVGRRMGLAGPGDFAAALKTHTTHVRNAYDRLFAEAEESAPVSDETSAIVTEVVDQDTALAMSSARVFASHMDQRWEGSPRLLANYLRKLADRSLNSHRALLQASRIAASLEKTEGRLVISEANLETLLQLCGSSDAFAETIAANPKLIVSLGPPTAASLRRDYRAILRAAVDAERSFPAEMTAL